MSARIRRLQAEYERLKVVFDGHPHISIAETSGRPPDRYVVEYRLKGLVELNGEIGLGDVYRAEISLGSNYPREMPRCVMLTPIFHPNIDHLAICTEDIGAAGQTLDQTIIFIGEMISFQAYNLQSPRNGDAARWTKENVEKLPLDHVDLVPPVLLRAGLEVEVAVAAAAAMKDLELDAPVSVLTEPKPDVAPAIAAGHDVSSASQCANCNQTTRLDLCANRHLTCTDCRLSCANCTANVCCLCVVQTCTACNDVCCKDCAVPCSDCNAWECLNHIRQCVSCMYWKCLTHISGAGRCRSCASVTELTGAAVFKV